MEIGVNILNFGPHATPDGLDGWARFAEDAGLGFAMISDHVAVTPDVAEQYPAPFWDPFTTLAWLAGRTSRIRLGTTVTVLPYRHPLQTARVTANLDRFSGGRLIFGVGVGWSRAEYEALGVPFERRGALTDEYLDVVTRAWTADELEYAGHRVATGPRPAQTPRPPVWVGGNSPAALRRAVRFGDAWHILFVPPDRLRDEGLPALRAAADASGRPVPALAPRIQLNLTDAPLNEDRPPGHGTLDQVRRDVEAYRVLGATHLLLDTYLGDPAAHRPPAQDQAMIAELTAPLT
ncbi:TIGR03619 family F420-dependent LLM class oxidoreductase [Spirillospora sp. NBC_01491]|uniref:TIGR03619 family F420-dependent LLM class oxidoreductase n=1 Tax=Spirillospora sp. NBC_01491 TaxID=2976007 RepID=UPI002E361E71|nr:TIGR03619 family F420-dependent LLM class oxidoreductase [Spirillospora sp. NBC_01491]